MLRLEARQQRCNHLRAEAERGGRFEQATRRRAFFRDAGFGAIKRLNHVEAVLLVGAALLGHLHLAGGAVEQAAPELLFVCAVPMADDGS